MPPRKLTRRLAAKQDVSQAAREVRKTAGTETANRFLDDFDHIIERLQRSPELGPSWPTSNPELHGLRRVIFRNFPYSVFYRPTDTILEIVRVLHHSRDIPALLENL